jgi:thiazole synthase ThiGH ThiG subunit
MKEYKTITIHKVVGCGAIYCIFTEDDGAFHKLFIKGDTAKETPCGESWFQSLSKLLTFALRRSLWEGTTKEAVIKQLLGQRCNKVLPNKEHTVSCADAIAKAVLQYLDDK